MQPGTSLRTFEEKYHIFNPLLRCRPVLKKEKGGERLKLAHTPPSVTVIDPDRNLSRSFGLGALVDSRGAEGSQDKVYDIIGPHIVKTLESGIHCSLIAYGATGTGKTYTLLGPANDLAGDKAGILPRSCHHICGPDKKITCSFI